ncbi:MAG TPA: PilN domain-containing protein [Gammaproteobacteria bacterium]|nr:PilN domain-containing protein [Gammaproteobacteria bacterium]
MKQQINLYQVEKRKWVLDLTFQYLVWGGLAFLGILLIITANATFKNFSVKRELTQLQKEQMGKSKALQMIAGQIPEERTREQLVNEIKKYESEKQVKQEILNLLAAKSGRDKGFSSYLEALSAKTLPGLWFTKLSFKENSNVILLEGSATKPEYVPNLITGLSNDSAFSGKNFQLFKASLNEKTEQIDFVLETKSVKQP